LLSIFLIACEQEEPSLLEGKWELVNVKVKNYRSNGYTGNWSKMTMQLAKDTLYYSYIKGVNFSDTTIYKHRKLPYDLQLDIQKEIEVSCCLHDLQEGVVRDTSYIIPVSEGTFDKTPVGGEAYNYKIAFGPNRFYIKGLSDSNHENVLYIKKEDLNQDTLIIRNDHHDYQPSTYQVNYKYIFQRISG